MAKRKQYPLRIDPAVWEAIERWAADDMRSANGQVEWILREALRKAGVVLFDEETCEALMPRGDGAYWVYMLRCADDTLYTGITTDVARRMSEHMSAGKLAAKYTRVHGVAALEVVWPAPDRAAASALEYRIKRMPRAEKLALIGRWHGS